VVLQAAVLALFLGDASERSIGGRGSRHGLLVLDGGLELLIDIGLWGHVHGIGETSRSQGDLEDQCTL